MALIDGSIESLAPRVTEATPPPVVVATMPFWIEAPVMVVLEPRLTVTVPSWPAPPVTVALMPMPVSAWTVTPVLAVSTSTLPVPLVVASTPSVWA